MGAKIMVFSSETFLFLFLPVFLFFYYITPTQFRSWTILIGSYVFYAWWRVDFLALFFAVTAWAYGCGLVIARHEGTRLARRAMIIGICGCLTVLGIFKYLNFFIDSFAAMQGTDAANLGVHWKLILPIGVSFYVFHAIGYIVDVHRKDISATRNFVDFAAFMALFPHMIAGPVLRFRDLADQFVSRTHSLQIFSTGICIFTVGLAKKVLLADSIAPIADQTFGTLYPGLIESWLGAIAYMLQLYFDFSGYSDMAIGLALMMGFTFKPNFNTPYLSISVTDFWQRWHISLSTWLRDYLYIPLGGNRLGPVRTYVNLFLVMLLGGFWHGANWTFILWGAWHGGWLAVERYLGFANKVTTRRLAVPMTLLIVLIGWVMFRAANVSEALGVYAGMLGVNGLAPDIAFLANITSENLFFLVLAIGAVMAEPHVKKWTDADTAVVGSSISVSPNGTAVVTPSLVYPIAISILFILTVARLSEQAVSPFLYFQF
jgi:alginate O-acetyltransferase complex protein AlgI